MTSDALTEQKSLGPYVSFTQLAAFQLAAKRLSLKKNQRALNHLSGPFKAASRGRGMEFDSVRQYQAGDDIRSIDWRVTARTGKTHTKQFREEKEVPVILLVDQRQRMFFGSEKSMKSVIACDIAALISWAALNKGDRIGAMLFNDERETDIRPLRQRKTVLTLLNHLSEYNQALSIKPHSHSRSLNNAFAELRRIVKPGSQIFIISDFHDFDEKTAKLLYDLSRHNDITAIKVHDKLEEQLPASGSYQVSDGIKKLFFDSSKKQQQRYHNDFSQQQERLKKSLGQYKIPLIQIRTSDAALPILQQYLGA